MRPWLLIATLGAIALSAAAGQVPWQRRFDREVEVRHKQAHSHVRPEMWPAEPESPDPVDGVRFREALGGLCGPMPDERLDLYAAEILGRAADFEVDPFVIAALVYDRSGCRPMTPDKARGRGLTRINVEMHAPHIRGGEYRYYLRDGDGWQRHVLAIGRWPFNRWKADKTEPNLYFTAAILKVLKLQCADLDARFGGAPHRHPVSHWFYGDKVREIEPEDRVLTVRRRLLALYNEVIPEAIGTFRGFPLVSPLDGTPRLVLDHFGRRRGGREGHVHNGTDLVGHTGEPVRAVTSGLVVFAGVDTAGAGSRSLTPDRAAAYPRDQMGPGGLYVAIKHGDGFRSYYMHLDSIDVRERTRVDAGDQIGTLGRTGTAVSGPHLHLEFRVGTDRVDPAPSLADGLVDPFTNRDAEQP